MGPKEQEVRATLTSRPAGVLYKSEEARKVNSCFAGLFNGARSRGWMSPKGGLSLGKAECEWDWQEIWPRMVLMGLVEFELKPRPNHPDFGGFSADFTWGVTDFGLTVREDDNKYFKELMEAIRADEPEGVEH
jgi:hypothetical protein